MAFPGSRALPSPVCTAVRCAGRRAGVRGQGSLPGLPGQQTFPTESRGDGSRSQAERPAGRHVRRRNWEQSSRTQAPGAVCVSWRLRGVWGRTLAVGQACPICPAASAHSGGTSTYPRESDIASPRPLTCSLFPGEGARPRAPGPRQVASRAERPRGAQRPPPNYPPERVMRFQTSALHPGARTRVHEG